jgi:uncharacterized protein
MTGAGPVGEGERAEILDILRGFALLGIFVAHVPGFSGWDYLSPLQQAALDPGLDGGLQFLRDVFVRGKFFSLFSLLFGIGFALQLASAERKGGSFRSTFRRRQLGLLAIGVFHSAVWHGDILLKYALLGLALIPTASWKPARLLRWASVAFAARALWGVLMFGAAGALGSIGESAVGDGSGGVDVGGSVSAVTAGYTSSHWGEMLLANARFVGLKWLLVLYEGKLLSITAFFLLGAAIGKAGVHLRVPELRSELARVFWLCAGVGLAGNAALALLWPVAPIYPPSALGVATNGVYAIAVPSLALAFAAGIALLDLGARGHQALRFFAAPGRMALTTYLTQTAIGLGVFYGIGLGWRGTFSLTDGIAMAFLVFAAQSVFASAWLQRFHHGPCEWMWRCFTYGRVLPLRCSARRVGDRREPFPREDPVG